VFAASYVRLSGGMCACAQGKTLLHFILQFEEKQQNVEVILCKLKEAKKEMRHKVLMMTSDYGSTALSIACENNKYELTEDMMKTLMPNELQSQLLRMVDGHGLTPVHHCCKHRRGCVFVLQWRMFRCYGCVAQ